MKHVRLLLSIHRWCGLITGINILILSLTGAYLVFTEEIVEAFKGPEASTGASVSAAGASAACIGEPQPSIATIGRTRI